MSWGNFEFGGNAPVANNPRKRKPSDDQPNFPSALPNTSNTNSPLSSMANYVTLNTPTKRFKTASLAAESSQQLLISPRPPTPPITRPPAIDRVLDTLDKSQIITILTTLIQQHPTLSSTIAQMLPRPTLKTVSTVLSGLEKKLNDSFPFNKWGPDRSDYSFNRVRPILIEVKDAIMHYMPYFIEPISYTREMAHEYPDHAFGFLQMATTLAHRLPLWQNASHNDETRGDLYIVLGRGWNTTCTELVRRVKEEGKMYTTSMVAEWGQNLLTHAEHVGGRFGFAEAVDTFRASCGWMTPESVGGLVSGGATSSNNNTQPYAWMASGYSTVNNPPLHHPLPSLQREYR
ncbi:hypothetical protein SmJEL517_g05274 [Synchytrium microbalum]|uniref:Tethering factor for nuclear proteasome STS1 n=1 Tax=Synchytrium microbalum TaxID=1806994 RepID=A0A507C1N3_9FUNG|nr:uncharacterized protein SmJEL517_g05274 [Synchytrium microbalum]TPX31413.1 hypothetical protein SmJEL517_g05274 [Synchytrium microbalum]